MSRVGQDVDEFIRDFKESRRTYHKRTLWAEKWANGQVIWRDNWHFALLWDGPFWSEMGTPMIFNFFPLIERLAGDLTWIVRYPRMSYHWWNGSRCSAIPFRMQRWRLSRFLGLIGQQTTFASQIHLNSSVWILHPFFLGFVSLSIFLGWQTLDRKFSNRTAITLPIHSDENCLRNDWFADSICDVYQNL